jgi:CheY-like chemotaxis protein
MRLVVSKISSGDVVDISRTVYRRCTARPGRGTLAPVPGRFRARTLPNVSTPVPTPAPARLRACVVDDHAVVREWLVQKLETVGFDVCASAETLKEGVTAILTHHPDLAVVDNRLPDGRGIDLCREVFGAAPDVALILHTGMISPLEESQAYEAGVVRIALKSIQGDDLMAAVSEVAARRCEG